MSAIAQENLKAESESSTSARASTDAERQAARKEGMPTATTSDGENAPVAGLLRTIQKPLSTIGKMFADEPEQASQQGPAQPQGAPPQQAGSRPAFDAQEAAARQASAEAAEARKIQRAEHKDVVE